MALKKHHIIWFAWIVFFLTILHAYFDVTTSSQGGVIDGNRSFVHLFVILITAVEGVYVLTKPLKNNTVSYLSLPLFAIGFWMILSNMVNLRPIETTLFYLVFIVWWIVTIRFYANYTQVNYKKNRLIAILFIVLFFLWIWLNTVAQAALFSRNHRYGITMFVYNIVLLVPFIFFIKSKLIRNLCILLSCFMVIFSLKRGAIVTLPVMLLAFYTAKYKMENKTMKILLPVLIFGGILVVILLFMNEATNGLLFERFDAQELQSGSGRNELRGTALEAIAHRDFATYLFGAGSGSSVELLGTGVHNEWVESFFSYGLIGVFLYAWMTLRLIRYTLKLVRKRNYYAPYLAMYCAYLVMCSLFSGFLYMHVAFYFWAGTGFFIGLISAEKKQITSS